MLGVELYAYRYVVLGQRRAVNQSYGFDSRLVDEKPVLYRGSKNGPAGVRAEIQILQRDSVDGEASGRNQDGMIEIIVAMRKKANKLGWIWEDIEELADQEYCRNFTARLGAVNTMVTESSCQEQTLK